MFRIDEFKYRETTLGKYITTPPDLKEDYGITVDENGRIDIDAISEFDKPIAVFLPDDAVSVIGFVIEKYEKDYEKFISEFDNLYIKLEDKLTSSHILRTCTKIGFKKFICHVFDKVDTFYKIFKIMDDIHWFIRTLIELYDMTCDDDLQYIIGNFEEILSDMAFVVNKSTKLKKMKRKSFRPFPRWIKAISLISDRWHINLSAMLRIVILEALNTEIPIKSFNIIKENIVKNLFAVCSNLNSFLLQPSIKYFAKSVLKKYDKYIFEKIADKDLTEEVRNVIMEVIK